MDVRDRKSISSGDGPKTYCSSCMNEPPHGNFGELPNTKASKPMQEPTRLGVWEGYWKEMILATRLTVERIEGDIVTAVYWRGAYIFPGLQKPSQQRIEGRFLDEKTLRFEVWDDANNRWAEATYTMTGDGTLTATWKSGGIVATALLKKEP